jgi:hypothetical protein
MSRAGPTAQELAAQGGLRLDQVLGEERSAGTWRRGGDEEVIEPPQSSNMRSTAASSVISSARMLIDPGAPGSVARLAEARRPSAMTSAPA